MAKENRVSRNVLEELLGDMATDKSKTKLKGILEPTAKKPEKPSTKKATTKSTPIITTGSLAKKVGATQAASKNKADAKPKASGPKVHRAKFDPDMKVRVLKPNAEVIERWQSKFDVLKKSKTVGEWYEKCRAKNVKGVGIPFLYDMIDAGNVKIG